MRSVRLQNRQQSAGAATSPLWKQGRTLPSKLLPLRHIAVQRLFDAPHPSDTTSIQGISDLRRVLATTKNWQSQWDGFHPAELGRHFLRMSPTCCILSCSKSYGVASSPAALKAAGQSYCTKAEDPLLAAHLTDPFSLPLAGRRPFTSRCDQLSERSLRSLPFVCKWEVGGDAVSLSGRMSSEPARGTQCKTATPATSFFADIFSGILQCPSPVHSPGRGQHHSARHFKSPGRFRVPPRS